MLRVLKNWSPRHRISLIMPKLGYQATKEMLPNVDLYYFSSKGEEELLTSLFKRIFSYFVRIIRSIFISPRDRPDIIITASHLLYDIIPALILRKRYRSKLVVYNHGVWGPYRSYNEGIRSNLMLLNEKISIFLCKRSPDIIFAINEETKTFLIDKGFQANKIFMMRNGVEHELIQSVQVNRKDYEASFCARLVKRKGIYDLIDIWRKVLQCFPNGRMAIIGQGEEYENLKKAIKTNGLEQNIELKGYVSDIEKISFFKSSKLFVYPSYEESWGITVTEAMACQLPVICYNLSAYNFLKRGIIKLNPGNKDMMASSILNILSNEDRRIKLGLQAEDESKKLDWDDISEQELGLISRQLSNEGPNMKS